MLCMHVRVVCMAARDKHKELIDWLTMVMICLQKSANRNGALTDRKIGPAISRRLYKVFMETDPASTDV